MTEHVTPSLFLHLLCSAAPVHQSAEGGDHLWQSSPQTHKDAEPVQIFGGWTTLFTTLGAVAVLTGQMKTTSNDGTEWLVKQDILFREAYGGIQASKAAIDRWDVVNAVADRQRSVDRYTVTFIYTDKAAGNLFTPDILNRMREVRSSFSCLQFHVCQTSSLEPAALATSRVWSIY